MSDDLLQRLEKLVAQGTQLVPLGGFEFSGYNARLQNMYLEWRKKCLESLEQAGPIGFPYKNKILGDENGGYFFQSSAQLILSGVRELYEKLKGTPELAAQVPAPAAPAPEPVPQPTPPGGTRVLKPPPKPDAARRPQTGAPQPAAPSGPQAALRRPKRVYVIGEPDDPLRVQLSQFLSEIGVEEIAIDRKHGEMIVLENVADDPEAKYAFFIFNSDDLTYAMFELGHFVGKLGRNHVCVMHMTDVEVPKNIPGVVVKPIVVKLEEASLSILKELKAAGYTISL